MGMTAKAITKFFIVAFVMLIVCMIAWGEFVDGVVYQSTDSIGGAAFFGGGYAVDFKYGDTLRPGWTVTDLWVLWWAFVVISIVICFLLTRMRWRRSVVRSVKALADRFLPP